MALEGNEKSDNQEEEKEELDRLAYEVGCVWRVPSLGATAVEHKSS